MLLVLLVLLLVLCVAIVAVLGGLQTVGGAPVCSHRNTIAASLPRRQRFGDWPTKCAVWVSLATLRDSIEHGAGAVEERSEESKLRREKGG